jgi:hypothetical protein
MAEVNLDYYLSKFDSMVDLDFLAEVKERYARVFNWEKVDPPVSAEGSGEISDEDWPDYAYNDTVPDPAKMLLSQLRGPFFAHQKRADIPVNIRSNYGTPILPSIFGGEWQLTESSLPWAHHLPDRDAIRALIDAGIPDLHNDLGGRCFETAEFYMETLKDYANLEKAVNIYHPDLQGPFDVAHLLWGPDIFLSLYDCPEMVHELLDLITETYIAYLKEWKAFTGEGNDIVPHWGFYMKGGAMVRDDTPIMISTAQYNEFVKPYDQRILDEFGGCIHFCGTGDNFIASMCESDNLYGINASQPDWNDMELFWEATRGHDLVVLGMAADYVPQDIDRGVTLNPPIGPGRSKPVES